MPAVDPAVAHYRARVGALSRDRNPDDSEYLDARRDLAVAGIEQYIERVLSTAPPLTEEQRIRLAELLKPVRQAPKSNDSAAARKSQRCDRSGRAE